MVYEIFKNGKLVGEFFFQSKDKALEYLTILKKDSYSTWSGKRVK